MRIIISPAKKMRTDTDGLTFDTLPLFLPEADRIKRALQDGAGADGALSGRAGCHDTRGR